MDMKISGSGQLPAGEYERVSVSGSGKCLGNVKCVSFSASGSAKCEGDITCTEGFTASGSAHAIGAVVAKTVRCAGSFHAERDVTARELAHFSGSCRIEGNCISQGKLDARGSFSVGNEIEAEYADIRGVIKCRGLLNAENLYMELEHSSRVHSIGGGTIEVRIRSSDKHIFSFFRLRRQIGGAPTVLQVDESIEGDSIYLEGVRAASVVGRSVVIGVGCEIDVVRYSESIEIAEDAVVRNCEKTDGS